MNKSLKKWLDTYEYQVNEQDGFYFVIKDLQTGDIYKKTMPQLLVEFIDTIENKLNYEEDINTTPFSEWQLDIRDMQQELQQMILEYDDIKNHKQVYVVYDKSGCTWCEETMKHCIDGVEDVFLDENGIVYTVDKQGSKLTDLDHYIEYEGIKVYSL